MGAAALLFALACERVAPRAAGPPPVDAAPVARRTAGPDAATLEDEIRAAVVADVQGGFRARADIIERAVEVYGGEPGAPADLEAQVTRWTDAALAEQRRREAGWTAPTDCDRLDRAFALLEARGIFARQNFEDCQTCGMAEMERLIEAARAAGRKVEGYVYYHEQDLEKVVANGNLWLAYGAADNRRESSLAVARSVVATLAAQGLKTRWSGTTAERIAVVGLDWRRRRFSSSPGPSPAGR